MSMSFFLTPPGSDLRIKYRIDSVIKSVRVIVFWSPWADVR